MKIVDFFECENSNYWLEQISKTDWRSGKYLYELLKSNLFHEKAGNFAKALLLVDDDLLLAFCTVSEKKYDIESLLCPWIGFVYTFPEYRGKHYSKRLLCFAEKIVYEHGFEKIYISTKHIGLYEKYGYVFDQMMKDWRGEEQRIYCKSIKANDEENLQRKGQKMLKSDFYYDLPEELIAQTPLEPRDSSRLMKIDRQSGAITHDRFYNICDYLKKGDLLVMNDSKVFPARIYGEKHYTRVPCEFLLLKRHSLTEWETMVKPGRRLKPGAVVDFPEGLSAEVLETLEGGNRLVKFTFEGDFYDILDRIGQMPLPPYITEKLQNNDRYNTIYCRETGSAAAPTAGLHFTEKEFAQCREMGIDTAFVTLHVGLGTFRPVKEDDILDHKMHTEHYTIPPETAEKIRACKERGGRVIAVGTTSCRTLESAAQSGKSTDDTSIFIYPGYEFKCIDGLITNFHLPESTLIMLVSAFLGREKTLAAYNTAIKERYRFFSFGDCMLIV